MTADTATSTAQPWYAGALSPEQAQAVGNAGKTSSILASAGSGKTRTLVYALANDILGGVPPESVIAFTFTKKAAQELLARVHYLLRERAPNRDFSSLSIGTIHSWCFEYLLTKPNFYNFEPLDEDIQVYALVTRLHDELGLASVYDQPFPRGIRPFLADLQVYYNENLPLSSVPDKIRPAIERFEQALMKNRLLTFGGMVTNAIKQLGSDGPVEGLRRLYVDEYQDVNPAQVALIKAMVPKDAAVIAVGDDLQCIYNWRGSDVRRIVTFDQDFPGATTSPLVENYRSRNRIVQFCNAIAENITLRYPKQMSSTRGDSTYSGVLHASCVDEADQSRRIADVIEQFHATGVPYSAMAVLLRSISSAAPPLLAELAHRQIPTLCPLQRETGEFIEHFLLPIFDWLQGKVAEPKNELEAKEAQQRVDALWSSAKPFLKGDAADPMAFWQELGRWRQNIAENSSDAYNVRKCLYSFLSFCGIGVRTDTPQIAMALGIASQIIRAVEEIHRRRLIGSPRKSAHGVMREVFYALRDNKDELGESTTVAATEDAVVVTTVHQSKGLEWPIVILGTLNKNRFPVPPSRHGTSYPDLVASRYGTTEQDELRLFYVACSRARERLFFFDFANDDGAKQSPFLARLANALLKAAPEEVDDEAFSLTDEELDVHHETPLRLGLSDLLVYVDCPYQYALRRLVGVQPAIADDLGYGKSIHELAQRRFGSKQDWAADELERQVDTYVHLPYVGDVQLAKSKAAIKRRIASLQKAGAFTGEVLPEVKTEVAFHSGLVFGVIDCVIRDDDSSARIRDWKTNVHAEFADRYGDQQRFYVHALRLRGNAVASADLVDVGQTHKNGTLAVLPLDVSEAAVESTVSKLDSALKGIAERRFPPMPSSTTCGGCDMRSICGHKQL